MAAGLAGGLVASWTMNQFQAGWSKVSERGGRRAANSKCRRQAQAQGDNEGPTQKLAGAVSATVLRRELSTEEKRKFAPVVHYAFGAVMGGVYGVLAEMMPRSKVGFGTAYGTAVFAGVDEAGLAVLGLAKSPVAYPLSTHAYALASHVVYGATTEGVRRAIRKVW